MIVEIEEFRWSEETTSVSSLQKLTDGKEQLLQELKNITDPKSLCTYIEDGTFFIAIPMKEGNRMSVHLDLIELLRKHEFLFYVGIGHVRSALLGYRESYQQAQQSVSLMKKFNVSQKGCFIEEWGIVPYLNAIPQEIQTQYIQKYSRSSRTLSEDQKRTLQIYMECELDVKRTADLLHIHRNTLFYRLDKISQQLGLDYRKFNDLVIIKLLLIFDRLQP
jgi:carbohydrate diacid regulator